MSKVFVLDTQKQPLSPVHPGRARVLLSQGKAAAFKRFPFTIILKTAVESNSGTNRISNLTLACEPCNRAKGTQDIRVFLARKPAVFERILSQAKAPLKDAAAVNTTRWMLSERLKALGLPKEGPFLPGFKRPGHPGPALVNLPNTKRNLPFQAKVADSYCVVSVNHYYHSLHNRKE
jgi:hypothetical protein